ncbi:ABC transporter ATP-binding protein [Listeria kieliensis]|uniref:ABC transporter ATP-binding protein n=1 Tax=Listeria kieliensis TaxID=1621700 RepID=UPI000E21A3CE|nr:ABC transporter ATP-binding protein [Listeria kieliensis]
MLMAKQLKKKIHSKEVIKQFSYQFTQKQITAIIGPNGSGKTTLMRILSGIYTPDQGEVSCSGETQSLFFLQDGEVLYPYLTGGDHLTYIQSIYKSKITIKEVADNLGILELLNKKIKSYSLGMKQQLLFAEIVISDADILILDEPFNGLDPSYNIRFKEILKKLKNAGKTILISSHILADIEELADKQIFIKNGEIVEIVNRDAESESENDQFYKIIIPNLEKEMVKRIEKISAVLAVEVANNDQLLVQIKPGHFKMMVEAFKEADIEYKDVIKLDQDLTQLYKKIYNKD